MNEIHVAEKEALLATIRQGIAAGTVSPEDVLALVEAPGVAHHDPVAHTSRITAVQLIQYVGGLIVLLGIGAFVSTFWSDIGAFERVIIALGGSVLAYILGVTLMRVDTKSSSGVAFHVIAGCLLPFGLYVPLNEFYGLHMTSGVLASISLILLMVYALSYMAIRTPVFTLFMLANSITFLYAGIYALMPSISYEFIAHLTLLIGAVGIYIGTTFKGTLNAGLSETLYFFGSVAVLCAPASIFHSVPVWELAYPFLLAFMLYVSVLVRSKRIMFVSVIGIMGYVVYITSQYFADVVGWPIALIMTGILLILIGYGAVQYKDKI